MLDIIAIFLSVTALLAYVNRRYVGLPSAIWRHGYRTWHIATEYGR